MTKNEFDLYYARLSDEEREHVSSYIRKCISNFYCLIRYIFVKDLGIPSEFFYVNSFCQVLGKWNEFCNFGKQELETVNQLFFIQSFEERAPYGFSRLMESGDKRFGSFQFKENGSVMSGDISEISETMSEEIKAAFAQCVIGSLSAIDHIVGHSLTNTTEGRQIKLKLKSSNLNLIRIMHSLYKVFMNSILLPMEALNPTLLKQGGVITWTGIKRMMAEILDIMEEYLNIGKDQYQDNVVKLVLH